MMIFRVLGAQWFAAGFVGIISLLTSILIARTLEPDSFGVYSVALSGGAMVAILLNGGFGTLLQRERAQVTQTLREFLPILPQAALGHVILAATTCSFLAGLTLPKHALTVLAVIWFFAASISIQFGLSILRGDGRLVRDASWQIGSRSFTALCVVVVIGMGAEQPWQMFLAQCVGAIAFALLVMRYLHTRPLWRIPPAVYGVCLPFVWLELASVIHFRADMLLLQWFDIPKFEIGNYGVAYRLIEAVILLASPIALLLFRRFRLNSASPQKIMRDILPILLGSMGVGFLAMAFFLLYSTPLVRLVYGSAYAQADQLLRILGCALLFILPNSVLTQAALALGIERWLATSVSLAAVVNVLGNALVIPAYGLPGAAWMRVATEGLLGICVGIGIWRCRTRENL